MRSSRGKRILFSAMRLAAALEMRKSVPVKQLAYLLSVDRSPPCERFFAAVSPRKLFLRVCTRPRGVQAVFRGVCGERGVSHRRRANTRGAGDAVLSPLERASIAFVCTSALGRRTDKCPGGRARRFDGALPQTPWHETRESYRNQKEVIHEQGYRFQHPHFQ